MAMALATMTGMSDSNPSPSSWVDEQLGAEAEVERMEKEVGVALVVANSEEDEATREREQFFFFSVYMLVWYDYLIVNDSVVVPLLFVFVLRATPRYE